MDDPMHPTPGQFEPAPPRPARVRPTTQQPTPRCSVCRYDLTGLRVEECCPECGSPVWLLDQPLAHEYAKVMARGQVSLCAAITGLVLSLGCGPLGAPLILWALFDSIRSLRERAVFEPRLSRVTPGFALGLAIIGALIELAWLYAIVS
ncbi:MAG: hypothetical protein DHS20C14_19480 [Phycisphaeraceae bacterium]|nr:MAG: hypothetical protein DHS20C14_19480 [Phycisphaeraceae bacterium]